MIEDIDEVDSYLTKDMRVTKEEYANAMHDEASLERVLIKINDALGFLTAHISPQTGEGINIFSGFLTMLDQNLVTIQEHHIYMKDHLENGRPQKNIGICQTCITPFK